MLGKLDETIGVAQDVDNEVMRHWEGCGDNGARIKDYFLLDSVMIMEASHWRGTSEVPILMAAVYYLHLPLGVRDHGFGVHGGSWKGDHGRTACR